MANPEHLKILMEGVDRWNQWRKDNPEIRPDLSGADLISTEKYKTNFSEINFSNANLSSINLSGDRFRRINLSKASFSKANLSKANLSKVNNLQGAMFYRANLREVNFSSTELGGAKLPSTTLSNANLNKAQLHGVDLTGATACGANFCQANLTEARLIATNLDAANLSHADLSRTQTLATRFGNAVLTGACIKDWNINKLTYLDHVVCEFIYLEIFEQERRPSNHNEFFASGDFARLVRKGLEAVDLIFSKGIDWKAFALSLEDLRVEYAEQDLSIQAIENKNDAFVIRLNVPPDADKGAIERQAKEFYEMRLAVLEAQYQTKLKSKGKKLNSVRGELEEQRRRNTWMEGIIETMAEKENSKYDLRGSKFGGGFAGEGGMQIGGTFIDASSNPTLIEVAQEIQQIHDQLLQTQSSKAIDEFDLAKQVKAELEKRPSLKQRFVGLIKSGGAEALKELVNRSGFNILLEAARGWANPE